MFCCWILLFVLFMRFRKPKRCKIERRPPLRIQSDLPPRQVAAEAPIELGVLTRQGDPRVLRLFGSPSDRRKLRFCYHAVDADQIRFQVEYNGVVCNTEKCCVELEDGSMVRVRGLEGEWVVSIDRNRERQLWR